MGVDIPVLILDAGLRVRRFTPKAALLLNLIPSDVGRPFSNIASNLNVSDWKELFAEVTGLGRSIEREVSDRASHRYSMRVQPYSVEADQIEGVLIVMLDTDLIYRQRDEALASGDLARTELARSEVNIRALMECTPQFVVGVNADQNIVIATGSIEKTFGYRPDELIGQPLQIHSRQRPPASCRALQGVLCEHGEPPHGDRTRFGRPPERRHNSSGRDRPEPP